jgi:hypothetical protein
VSKNKFKPGHLLDLLSNPMKSKGQHRRKRAVSYRSSGTRKLNDYQKFVKAHHPATSQALKAKYGANRKGLNQLVMKNLAQKWNAKKSKTRGTRKSVSYMSKTRKSKSKSKSRKSQSKKPRMRGPVTTALEVTGSVISVPGEILMGLAPNMSRPRPRGRKKKREVAYKKSKKSKPRSFVGHHDTMDLTTSTLEIPGSLVSGMMSSGSKKKKEKSPKNSRY